VVAEARGADRLRPVLVRPPRERGAQIEERIMQERDVAVGGEAAVRLTPSIGPASVRSSAARDESGP
jgi:hypothetical protein